MADTVSSAFISDINARFPLVCGQTVSFSPATDPNTPLLCGDIQKQSATSSDARYLQSHINDADENVSKQSVLVNSLEILNVASGHGILSPNRALMRNHQKVLDLLMHYVKIQLCLPYLKLKMYSNIHLLIHQWIKSTLK